MDLLITHYGQLNFILNIITLVILLMMALGYLRR